MNINQAIGKAGERWNSLLKRQKIIVAGSGAALIIALVFLGQWLLGSKYSPLFTDLSPEQGSAIMKQLDEMNIPYKIAGQGDTILVPEDVLYKTRLQLAGSGVLQGADKGFELFDETQLGSTDFDRQLNYQRTLQENTPYNNIWMKWKMPGCTWCCRKRASLWRRSSLLPLLSYWN